MITIEVVAQLASSLPEVTEGERFGRRTWFVRGKGFAWDRPFSKADLKRFGDVTPLDGPILAVSVGDLSEKEAVLAAHPDVADKIRGGKVAAAAALVGAVMKATRGRADASRVRELILDRLG